MAVRSSLLDEHAYPASVTDHLSAVSLSPYMADGARVSRLKYGTKFMKHTRGVPFRLVHNIQSQIANLEAVVLLADELNGQSPLLLSLATVHGQKRDGQGLAGSVGFRF